MNIEQKFSKSNNRAANLLRAALDSNNRETDGLIPEAVDFPKEPFVLTATPEFIKAMRKMYCLTDIRKLPRKKKKAYKKLRMKYLK